MSFPMITLTAHLFSISGTNKSELDLTMRSAEKSADLFCILGAIIFPGGSASNPASNHDTLLHISKIVLPCLQWYHLIPQYHDTLPGSKRLEAGQKTGLRLEARLEEPKTKGLRFLPSP